MDQDQPKNTPLGEAPLNHPMDGFPVRPLQFDFDGIENHDHLWSRTKPEFSMVLNALGVHVPYFERYLVRSLHRAKPHIKDEKLARDVAAIIGQEAHHAKNFINLNQMLAARYPKIADMDRDQKNWFAARAKSDDLKRMVGFTAGYETFTFLAGVLVLEHYEQWFEDADPTMKAMWVWHQVEEVEHGAVAFEVYRAMYGDDELYRKWMVLVALRHIAWETVKAYLHMSKIEGWWKNPFRGAKRLGFCLKILLMFGTNALPVLRKDYHPRQHPLTLAKHGQIQTGWRRFARDGGDVLTLDHAKMAAIMNIQPEQT